ncbi:transposase [Methylomonas sp. MED-D]|uniref:transposase n=1 Tax=Methylomonas TaxID=416 RepID=UPI000B19D529|nr:MULTISPECIES: transposase [Methylomonas]MDT4328319.1 transposase [Methylomonas sp. MV1]MDT4329068.1 transposase [Methylomonas sp. MV1]MDT4329072.1 transposase [Methylomonas sp. MV1]MDT4329297.1 transposase [Methylomonas sp. MV1]MDT4329321.1 transposase [Methylomonas sp. MV1]
MKEHNTRLSRPLIVGHGRDGRCLYDPEAKRELVKVCLHSGTSVAKIALQYGINANLLRKWMGHYRETGHPNPNSPLTLPAFVPVQSLSAEKPAESALSAELPNGVKLALQPVALSDLPVILKALAELPCFVSTQD